MDYIIISLVYVYNFECILKIFQGSLCISRPATIFRSNNKKLRRDKIIENQNSKIENL